MTKENIIQESGRLFYEIGFKTLTMDDVANHLAMSKKTLYELFGSKENLISEVLKENFEDIQSQFNQIQKQNLNAIEELLVLKKYVNQKFNTVQRQNCTYQLQRYYGKLYRKIFLAQNHKIIENLTANFKKGIQQGVYRSSLDAEFVAKLFLEIQNLLKSNMEWSKDWELQHRMMQTQSDIFIRGILSPEGQTKYEQLIQNQ